LSWKEQQIVVAMVRCWRTESKTYAEPRDGLMSWVQAEVRSIAIAAIELRAE
jgi:hypothetical protein